MTTWSGDNYQPLPPTAETGPADGSDEIHSQILSGCPEITKDLRILIVEDNKDMRRYIRYLLTEHYQVSEAADGASGLKEAIRIKPDLIITDIMMEGMDGLELCNQLREHRQVSHIPVIMLTALHTSADRIRGLETGADDYLTKPFNEQELLARIRNLITRREALRNLFTQEFRMEPSAPAVTSADARFIQRLIEIVEKNMENPDFDVTMLSNAIGLSRSQLHRRLSAITGQPATGFIRVIRMKRAAQLLKQRSGNISEVMYLVGFDNLSYFSKCFREVYNMTPREYISDETGPTVQNERDRLPEQP
jgi:DNA-binding response OmpR family regulator